LAREREEGKKRGAITGAPAGPTMGRGGEKKKKKNEKLLAHADALEEREEKGKERTRNLPLNIADDREKGEVGNISAI